MLNFLKKFFGTKPAVNPCPAPYKVEASEHFPFPKSADDKKPAKAKKPAVKKPAAKKAPKGKST